MVPIPLQYRPWQELTERDREFFCGDRYPTLPPNHAAQIRLLTRDDAVRLTDWAVWSIPAGWPDRGERFGEDVSFGTYDSWEDEAGLDEVRRWLFDRGIPFRREVFLLYERHRVVWTTWKILVRYWDAFAWSVGYEMLAFDPTLRWACCFHHEDVIIFGKDSGTTPTRRQVGPDRPGQNA